MPVVRSHGDTFGEEYRIRYSYQKPDGYWAYGQEDYVTVPVRHGVNEKDNHDRAKRAFLEQNAHLGKTLKVHEVAYV